MVNLHWNGAFCFLAAILFAVVGVVTMSIKGVSLRKYAMFLAPITFWMTVPALDHWAALSAHGGFLPPRFDGSDRWSEVAWYGGFWWQTLIFLALSALAVFLWNMFQHDD